MEAERRPAGILSYKSGSAGKYLIHYQVLDKDNLPVKGAVIRILDTDLPDGYYDLPPTDEHGTVIYKVEFDTEKKAFTVLVLGSHIAKREYL